MKKLYCLILILLTCRICSAQCIGTWSASPVFTYLCASGPFLHYDLGANTCPITEQATFTFVTPVQNFKLHFSALGTLGSAGQSRLAVFLNNSKIDLTQACGITIGCQIPTGNYSIENGCMVDSVAGSDGGISGYIYIDAGSYGLTAINSIGVSVSEVAMTGTIFQIDSCDALNCNTGIENIITSNFTVYPNPFNSEMHLSGTNSGGTISIYDLTGKLVLKQPSKEIQTFIQTESIARGLYILKYADSKMSVNFRLTKY